MRMRPARAPHAGARIIDLHPPQADLRAEVLEGLRKDPKELPPKLFYDAEGSVLFEEITTLPEYYLTRTEIGILQANANAMLSRIGESPTLIEFGSGSSTKVRILLDRLAGPATYVPVDISAVALTAAAEAIAADYHVRVIGICADYSREFTLPPLPGSGRRTIFFPGSNLGNLNPQEAASFFVRSWKLLRKGDGMLIGIDRQKDPAILNAAYNDSRGITAQFNKNILGRINRAIGADFDLAAFEHVAFYNDAESRIEMHLRSTRQQDVTVAGERFSFRSGETSHTENSYKYGEGDLETLIRGSGFRTVETWSDAAKWFSVYYLRVY